HYGWLLSNWAAGAGEFGVIEAKQPPPPPAECARSYWKSPLCLAAPRRMRAAATAGHHHRPQAAPCSLNAARCIYFAGLVLPTTRPAAGHPAT
ncbi:MAG: hypothetical protein SOY99_07045, partial [Alloprevotella sp.]|nr:hypothetical protein [Alloprevotella sp.]